MNQSQPSSSRSSSGSNSTQSTSQASSANQYSQSDLIFGVIVLWKAERKSDNLPHELGLRMLMAVQERIRIDEADVSTAIVKMVEGESFEYDVCAPELLDAIRNVNASERVTFRKGEKGVAVDKKGKKIAQRQILNALTGSLPRNGEKGVYAAYINDLDCLEKTTFTMLDESSKTLDIEYDQCEMIASCASDVLRPQYDFVTYGRIYACIHGLIVLVCWPPNENNLKAIAPTYDSAEDDVDCVELVSSMTAPYVILLEPGQMVQIPRGTMLATVSIKTSVTISWRVFDMSFDIRELLEGYHSLAGLAANPSFLDNRQRLECLTVLMGYEIGEQEACHDRLKGDPSFAGDLKKVEELITAMYEILHHLSANNNL